MTRTLEGDAALLAGFRRGDRAALADVYRAYVAEVVRAVRGGVVVQIEGQRVRVGKNLADTDVEVAVQDTFVRAFAPTARAAYDGVRPYGAYLATIARNALVDRARAARRGAVLVPLDDVEHRLDDEDAGRDPTWPIEDAELQAVLADAVAALDVRDQQVYRARYIEGLPQREAAAQLSLSGITVRRADARIRRHLLDALRREGHLLDAVIGIPETRRDRSKG